MDAPWRRRKFRVGLSFSLWEWGLDPFAFYVTKTKIFTSETKCTHFLCYNAACTGRFWRPVSGMCQLRTIGRKLRPQTAHAGRINCSYVLLWAWTKVIDWLIDCSIAGVDYLSRLDDSHVGLFSRYFNALEVLLQPPVSTLLGVRLALRL